MISTLDGHRPLIGVTTSEIRHPGSVDPTPEGEPPRHEMAIGLGYLRAIERAGGVPVVMPPLRLEAIQPLLGQLSGICLPGGPDINPKSYGATSNPNLGPTELALDGFELAVARLADLRGMPMLAIGRGMQVLNVVRGGTLHQHLPEISTTVEHRQSDPGSRLAHEVDISPRSRGSRVPHRRAVERRPARGSRARRSAVRAVCECLRRRAGSQPGVASLGIQRLS